MRTLCLFFVSAFITQHCLATDQMDQFLDSHWNLPKETREQIKQGEVKVEVEVETLELNVPKSKEQKFEMKVVALHTRTCSKVLRKLSRIEDFSDWLPFVTKSSYDPKSKWLTLYAEHMLLPFPMVVHIIIDRPTVPGVYPFTFPTGIFTGLQGKIHIEQHGQRCFFFASSNWKGAHTGISDLVIDLFATTLSKLGGELLIRKTQF